MLHLNEISKSFGAQVILDGAGLHVKPGMRLGLVGPNGAGKTTLLRVIAGELSLDAGEIAARKDLRIGLLPQEIEEIAGHSVSEEVLASYSDVLSMEHRLKALGEEIARSYREDGSQPDALLREMGELQTAFEAANGYELEARAQTILRGMGFRESDFERPISELSGGWRMRVALARLLLEEPDLLLMDEPTNHLDLESLIWLEDFLLTWPGALVVVSHDRYFLNRLVTHIVELDRGRLDLYAGNYDHFEEERVLRYESLANAAKNQQRDIQAAESFIRRFRAKNTKAKQVQQKIRQLERMERINAPVLERKAIRFRFPQPARTGRVVAEMRHVRKAYGANVVYKDLNLAIERGEKIALVGPNGAGKSTLLKLLAGVIRQDGGEIELGYQVRREYFAQHQLEALDPETTALKTMEQVAARVDRLAEVRSYLGAFLFGEQDVDKKVSVLSGGEKARLALAKMLLDPAGLLLLDEPTNHLDMASREVLTEALRQFAGAVVFISHDRHLINAIASKVIEVDRGRLTHYLGDWEYYQWKRGKQSGPQPKAGPDSSPEALAGEAPAARAGARKAPGGRTAEQMPAALGTLGHPAPSAQQAGAQGEGGTPPDEGTTSGSGGVRLSYKERKEVQRRYRQVEKRILALEERQEELGRVLSGPEFASDYEVLIQASDEALEVRDELRELYQEWELLAEKVASLDRLG